VAFPDFLKAVLDFQMREHEAYINGFVKKFREVDQDNNGIINEEEFVKLAKQVGASAEDITYFLQVVDPFNAQQITFSEAVQLFSSHRTNGDDGQPLIEQFQA